ncbi:PLP-dependent transferase [Aureobasidium pullulans]|uniref:PLP-dependent transferase n=1 Tax=Aureobasidium pullulans TaxID=5580 RepID=A0A4V4J8N4_AURPU|nr:PLP-dependent transferase [Aureobasidium pullulans]THY73182.1 PLP-dependent transferase [Aureobasidium pullulans]THZ42225.1 PLP-dependent transferase [Aureobasidium pullulans]THZ58717.1 PLP-dependent transferase [Aureobasidium pullulans]THZ89774.1 PLP-dependent transferase [Aureobasidium pullulans]
MRQVGSALWPRLRTVQVYGANTGVGKTVVSTLLCKALRKRLPDYNVHYLKPISTGPLEDQDNRHITRYSKDITSKTLLQFDDPVSPHIAARISKEPIDDQSILTCVYDELLSYATGKDAVAVVETAGGVLSPAPSGNVQADLYRPLRLPTLLVGDHRLGGIGSTISSWESLHVRGYDVNSVLLFEESRYDNHTYLKDYFKERGILTLSLPPPPEAKSSQAEDEQSMKQYYDSASHSSSLEQCIDNIIKIHDQRLSSLQSLPKRADSSIWHPFMQHTERSEQNILAIDSAYGDYFQTHNSTGSGSKEGNQLKPAFDGSASWWTQGLGHGNPALALTAAHAAGRYGHVMFAGAAHEPAVSLSETLLQNIGNPRLSKVFFSDNGSTGMEVAVKMALKAASKRYGWSPDDEVLILGLKGSYHGDTIGTMDLSEPSTYNKKVEWYSGRGHWFDFPLVKMQQGKWIVEPPAGMEEEFGPTRSFSSLDEVFALSGRKADADRYEAYIKTSLEALTAEGKKFGALIMEPVILGAGGMLFSDPLFQHILVKATREQCPELYGNAEATPDSELGWKGVPVVFDEVFTGLYRLGRFSSSSFVDVQPDISVHAKLLTGGLLPLCTTLASESIFEAFLSPEKSDALLHGHSYTAHAVGCDIAKYSLKTMQEMDEGSTWTSFKSAWKQEEGDAKQNLWSMWSQDFVRELSLRSNVESVFALGSVLAISLKDPAGSGYTSTAATGLRDTLLHDSSEENAIHSRVLGNVLYLMASMTTTPETIASIQRKVQAAI